MRHFLDKQGTDSRSMRTTMQYHEDDATIFEKQQMTEVIKLLNKEGLPWYTLTNVKNKIVNEFANSTTANLNALEDNVSMDIEKFKDIFY